MQKPLLQIALDTLTTTAAFANVDEIITEIEIIEIGTTLMIAQGVDTILQIKHRYPKKQIVANGRIADAGAIFAKMFFSRGADFITCICAAETATIAAVLAVAKSYGINKNVQVELTSHFTWRQAQIWRKIGITEVIYRRSRDAQAAGVKWSLRDLNILRQLITLGFKITLAGGIMLADISFFRTIPIHAFSVGRAIRETANPRAMALAFQNEIKKYWKD